MYAADIGTWSMPNSTIVNADMEKPQLYYNFSLFLHYKKVFAIVKKSFVCYNHWYLLDECYEEHDFF